MYNEADYVIKAFKENFKDSDEPLAIYGLGPVTEKLLENIKDYNIVGLMDGKKKSGEQWGIKIIDYTDVISLHVKKIIVIAKQPAIPVIFRRIEEFCRINNIEIYDVNGARLMDIYADLENNNPYFDINIDNLKSEIEKHDFISFDIFDTLLVRCILNPKDVFSYIEWKLKSEGYKLKFSFADFRNQSEHNLIRKHLNPDILDIYNELQILSSISDKEKRYLFEKEINTELELIRPRVTILHLFNEIKKRKKIYLVSDMYFTKKQLDYILKKNGYYGYIDIIVSCDYKKNKREGLFECLNDKVGKGKRILHIGDNYLSDVAALQESDIDTFYIMNERDMLAHSNYGKIIDRIENITDKMIMGRFVNKAFDNPFELYKTKGRLKVNSLEQYIYLFLAPVILGYCIWIIQKVREIKCDYILYTSRDGYLIKKIVEMLKEKYGDNFIPEGIYFYTSRRACLAATTYNYEDIKERLSSNYRGNIYSLFFDRFGIEIDEEAKIQSPEDIEKIFCYSRKYEKEILEHCREERMNYLSYIKRCNIQKYQRIAVIDLVAKGTVQNELEKLLTSTVVGMYFFKTDADSSQINSNMEFCSLYRTQGKYSPNCPNVYRLYRQLELILTSDEPTFHSIDCNGNKKFMKELRSESQIEKVRSIQKVILKYTSDIINVFNIDFSQKINETLLDEILGFTEHRYSQIEVEELSSMVLYSELENMRFTVTDNL